jgi:hypothetical protein
MKRFSRFALIFLCLSSTGFAKKKKVIFPPIKCIVVDKFGVDCNPVKDGWECNKVHVVIKPIPECNQYNPGILSIRIGK